MIEPYNAVGLIPSFWGIRRREEIKQNIEHLKGLTKAAFWLSNLDIPVRLLAIPEGALMGFNDEVLDVDHADYARTCCIDIPGPETDEIGKLARRFTDLLDTNDEQIARVANKAEETLDQIRKVTQNLNDVIGEFQERFRQAEPEFAIFGADPTFFAELMRGVVRRQREIDPLVDQQLASGWRLDRVDSILRAILRAGVFELLERPDVPGRVVINEYIEIAHAFFAEDEPKVVNGVLDKIARRLRPGEFG